MTTLISLVDSSLMPLMPSIFVFHNFGHATANNSAAASGISVLNIFGIKNDPAQRKIGSLHKLQKVFGSRIFVVYEICSGIYHFAQVVRRNVGGHADGDTQSAI